ncbi:MAG: DUF1080 domain-containing protein [Acidobacteriota bacterium]
MHKLFETGCLMLIGLSGMASGSGFAGPLSDSNPPEGAVILFGGQDTSSWVHRDGRMAEWAVKDGVLEIVPKTGDIMTRQHFGDFRLHLEFQLPILPPEAKGQARANSGVYLQGRYEIQILDSFNNETYANGMSGALYGQKAPDINACKPGGQWQSYDITFRSGRSAPDRTLMERPRVTVYHNGILIHDSVEIVGDATPGGMVGDISKGGPILLQDHSHPIRFRNIWLKPIK